MTADRRPDEIEVDRLDQQLATAENGDMTALTKAVATYETQLATAHEKGENHRQRERVDGAGDGDPHRRCPDSTPPRVRRVVWHYLLSTPCILKCL